MSNNYHTRTWHGRSPTEEDKKSIENLWYMVEVLLSTKDGGEYYQLAGFAQVANAIRDYFDKIGFWTYDHLIKELDEYKTKYEELKEKYEK